MEEILVIDPSISGISGDMFLSACVDLGANEKEIIDDLDGEIDILDVIVLLNCVLMNNSSEEIDTDINDDGVTNILDIVALVNIILSN